MNKHRCFDIAYQVRFLLGAIAITILLSSHLWAGQKPKVSYKLNMATGSNQCQELQIINKREGISYSFEQINGSGSLIGTTYCAPMTFGSCDEKPTIKVTDSEGMETTITIGLYESDSASWWYMTTYQECSQPHYENQIWAVVIDHPSTTIACCYEQVHYRCDGSMSFPALDAWCYHPSHQEGCENSCASAVETYESVYPSYNENVSCCPETGGGGGGGGGGAGSGGGGAGDGSGDGSNPSSPGTDSGDDDSSNGSDWPPGAGNSPSNDGGDGDECSAVGNPISILDGSKQEDQMDLSLPGPTTALTFTRYYNSLFNGTGSLGDGWNHTYGAVLSVYKELVYDLKIKDIDGNGLYFKKVTDSTYAGLNTELTTIESNGSGYTWKRQSGSEYRFDLNGRLVWIEDTAGNRKYLSYDNQNRLYSVTDDQSGRMITFDYDAQNRIYQVYGPATQAVPNGLWVSYQYNGNGNLSDVIYPDGSGFQYLYDDARFPNYLTEKKDRSGRSLASWTYDDQGRAISSQIIKGENLSIEYGEGLQDNKVTVTDEEGVAKVYTLTRVDGIRRLLEVNNTNACNSCGNSVSRYSYNDQYRIIQKIYTNGRIDQFFDYDANGRVGRIVQAYNSPNERTVYYTYHPSLDVLTSRKELSVLGPGYKETIWDYDNDGNLTFNEAPTKHVYRKIDRGYTLDALGQIVSYEYVTTYEYDSKGLLTAVDGPLVGEQDKVFYAYDPLTGDLLTVTAPIVGDTHYAYDAAGNLTSAIDVNGVQTSFTYDGRNRLLTSTRNGITSALTYTAEGWLDTTTDQAGRVLDYDYTDQGLLEKVSDPNGNYMFNIYDTQGRLIDASIFTANGSLTYYRGYDYGDLLTNPDHSPGKPWKLYHRNHSDTADLETVLTYDSAGKLSTVTDANSNQTVFSYDLLNRPIKVMQPGSIGTLYSYDNQDNFISVTDASGNITTYSYDDLGRLVKIVSPDTGATRYTYDEAGRLSIKTQNGKGIQFFYDALDRVTDIVYNDQAQNVAYMYDSGTGDFLVGRLSSMTDPSGSYEYSYDALGRLVSQTHTMGDATFTTTYGYDDAGNLRTISYPTGQVIQYLPNPSDPAHVSSVILNPSGSNQTLVSGLTYQPFGPLTGMTFGNGLEFFKTLDKNYQTGALSTTGILDRTYIPDNVGNILFINDNIDPTRSQSFVYDELYQLTGAFGVYGTIEYTYDQVGNRLIRTDSQGTDYYTYLAGTNQLRTVSGPNAKAYSYDYDGNTIAALGGQSPPLVDHADFTYNSNGQRIEKSSNSITTVQHFDQSGQLIAETNAAGNMIKAYVWLHGQPLAQITSDGSVYYYHNDHLGTPQRMTDQAANVVWAADYLPFGKADVTVEIVENSLRFAGQYFDQETGLHYNYHRYYDPKLGRYLKPDPIGQIGGINLYAYVQNNPVNYIDPNGLFLQAVYTWFLTNAAAINETAVFLIEDIQTGAYGYVNLAQDAAKSLYLNTKDFRGFDPSIIYRTEEFLNDALAYGWESYKMYHLPNPPPKPDPPKNEFFWESANPECK